VGRRGECNGDLSFDADVDPSHMTAAEVASMMCCTPPKPEPKPEPDR
jgi:hypothetical protein